MKELTVGKIRGLQQIARRSGVFIICAMDHRSGLISMMEDAQHDVPDYTEVVEMKYDMCLTMGHHASGILLDPEYGAAQCITSSALSGRTGLLVSVEATGYEPDPRGRITNLLKDWSVEKIKRMGASAVKMLLYYRPDIRKLADKQLRTVEKVAAECIKYDIPFLVEPKTYRVEGEKMDSAEFAEKLPEMVIQTAREITALPVDVLKAEFPADMKYEKDYTRLMEHCRRLDEASRIPWVILSAGVDFQTFKNQVTIACKAGASGFLGGRAIWQEAMELAGREERLKFFRSVAVKRLRELAEIAETDGRPWHEKFGLRKGKLADIDQEWYSRY
ncbi:MAG: tagatose 1,6-diphosphate aldolase [Dehalococcoidia bacterium]|nr:tagatose 1,6-diphosphate aldolase [Dehalococcoidia bacterium]